jgi:hypothetical protein
MISATSSMPLAGRQPHLAPWYRTERRRFAGVTAALNAGSLHDGRPFSTWPAKVRATAARPRDGHVVAACNARRVAIADLLSAVALRLATRSLTTSTPLVRLSAVA